MALGYDMTRSILFYTTLCGMILVFGLMVGYLNEEKPEEEKKPMLTASATFLVFTFFILLGFGLVGALGK